MNKVKKRRKNISIPKEKEHSTINYQNNFDYRVSLSANRPFKTSEKAKSAALEENLQLSAELELNANLKRSLLNLERSIRDSSVASRITEVGRFLESVELFHRTLRKKIASLRKSKESSTSTEKEIANARYTNLSDNPLIDISRYLDRSAKQSSSENIELALEVEINENLKRALAKATNNSSDLLDVTIIRPTDSDTTHETTVALNKTEVRDFISLVEQHRRTNNDKSERNGDKEKFTGNGNGHRKKKHIRSDGTDDSLVIDSSTYNRTGISGNQKQVYATVNTFDKLKASLACQNKNKEEDKPGTPCLCQHCGVVGVLVQSQKGPVATFPSVGECTHDNEPPKPKHRNKYERERRPPSPKDTKHRRLDLRKHKSIDQMDLLREINDRIKLLEKRIAMQEETAVPKEYLKNVLQKILTHYNFRQLQYSSRTTAKMRNNFTQYSTTKYISQKEPTFQCDHKQNTDRSIDRHADKTANRNVERDADRNIGRNTDIKSKKFQIHSLLQNLNQHADNRRDNREHEDNQTNRPSPQQENLNERQMKENIPEKDYWLWGEEVVKPGCDLKNKILKLLEEKATNKFTNSNEQRKSYQKAPEPKHFNTTPYNNYHDKLRDIKIECDENSIYLNVDESAPYNPPNTTNRVPQQNCYTNPKPAKTDRTSNDAKRKYNALLNMLPLQQHHYPFDVKKTIDDSTFRKNIEAYKDKFREKPKPPVEEKYFNEYACNSITTVSKASMEYIAQKMKNINFLESGLTREKEQYINEKYMSPESNPLGAFLKDKIHTRAFRPHKVEPELDPETPLQVTFVSPKINHWSDGSSNSDAKFISKQHARMEELNDGKICMEEKESLIYKLDFLKGLAKNKNIDQDRVFDRIWNQAKNTAKSKKDAVFIKIPIKTLNKYETNNNVVEMELTLEQLETVVKNAKAPRKPSQSTLVPLRLNYKSSSDVDVALRRHREMKKENRNMLNNKRNQSAKSNKHKEKTRYKEKI